MNSGKLWRISEKYGDGMEEPSQGKAGEAKNEVEEKKRRKSCTCYMNLR